MKKGDLKKERVGLLSKCSKMVEYLQQHNNVARVIHWITVYELEATDKGYDYKPDQVREYADLKLFWDFNIHTDQEIQGRRLGG